ncbi:hypothetical protein JX265_014024 [Neoarthrinium moseri]|uniref:Uncharacterized protein n=1 Tax=Neoarthrinium moseri TaxID=1658444 RepID=A0A9Q0AH30_9PEZI|nr:hypothetical protein JX265_014024 [Neoarthrinium moseri]
MEPTSHVSVDLDDDLNSFHAFINEVLSTPPETALREVVDHLIEHAKKVHHTKKPDQSGLKVDEAKEITNLLILPADTKTRKMEDDAEDYYEEEWMNIMHALAYCLRACMQYGTHKFGPTPPNPSQRERIYVFEKTALPRLFEITSLIIDTNEADDQEAADKPKQKNEDR